MESDSAASRLWGLLFFARMLVGIGAAPIQPYGISYMDDHATRSMAPMYMGILLSVTMIGPAFGYILGAAILGRYYIDFDRIDGEVNLTSDDPGSYKIFSFRMAKTTLRRSSRSLFFLLFR